MRNNTMKFKNNIKQLLKRTKFIASSLLAVAMLSMPATVMAGYGPNGGDRTIFDFSNPAQREGAFDGPRFNSYINTNVYGDERAFLDTKECVTAGPTCYQNGVSGGYQDQQQVTAGKEYIVRAYVHNIANPSINDNTSTAAPLDGIGVAKNAKIRFELPTGIANGFTAQARISADNSIPAMVYDTVDFKNDNQKYSIEYIPGSAYIFNASHTGGLQLNDEIVGANGTLIGADQMNGVYPGCFEYSSFVVIRVKVKAPSLEIQKYVSKVDMPTMADSSESVTVKRGEKISWRINFKNNGSDRATDVTIRDQLPAGLTIVPGSIKLTNADGTQTLTDTALSSGGINTGNYSVNGNGVIRFSTIVSTDPRVCEVTNVALVRATNVSELSDNAKVVISDCEPTTPTYSCDQFVLSFVDRKASVSFKPNGQNGATFKDSTIKYNADGVNKETVVFNTVNAEGKVVSSHTFGATEKNVEAVATVRFNVTENGSTTVKEVVCKDSKVLGTTTTTEKPKTLPNTGAGSIAGLMAIVTVAGAFLHRQFTLKRTNR